MALGEVEVTALQAERLRTGETIAAIIRRLIREHAG